VNTKSLIGIFCGALLNQGCASSSNEIAASYVSPVTYESWTCVQLREEAVRLSSRAAQAAGVQDDKASGDAALTAVAVVLFWPAAFALSGDGQLAAELGRLRGEMDAVEQASIRKNCGLRFSRTPVASSQPRGGYGYQANPGYPSAAPSAASPMQQRYRL
jgi:hypothetical protein